jgi:hypothetical protein
MSGFPSDTIPDGAPFGPHHIYLGALVALLVVWIVSDDRGDREAWLVGAALLAALFGFALTWQYYPPVGAAITLAGLTTAVVAALVRPYWAGYAWVGHRGVLLVGLLVALDDALEHAFGWPMPLDLLWKRWLFDFVSSF